MADPTIPKVPLAVAAREAGVSAVTAWRWAKVGVVVDGRRVRLQAQRVGGTWKTDLAWLHDFIAELTAGSTEGPPAVRTPAAQRRAGEAAAKKLTAMGL